MVDNIHNVTVWGLLCATICFRNVLLHHQAASRVEGHRAAVVYVVLVLRIKLTMLLDVTAEQYSFALCDENSTVIS